MKNRFDVAVAMSFMAECAEKRGREIVNCGMNEWDRSIALHETGKVYQLISCRIFGLFNSLASC